MRFEAHVAGFISREDLWRELETLADSPTVVHEDCTVLSAELCDQAALHGLIHQLCRRGLRVVSVRRR